MRREGKMIPDMLKQILSNQVVLAKEIIALKQEIEDIKTTQSTLVKGQSSLETLIERSNILLREEARVIASIAEKLEVEPELTDEEIRRQIELQENSLPNYRFGKM